MALHPKEIFQLLYAPKSNEEENSDSIGDQFLTNLTKHLYDESLCSVLVRCLVFNNTFFKLEEA